MSEVVNLGDQPWPALKLPGRAFFNLRMLLLVAAVATKLIDWDSWKGRRVR